MTEVTGAAATFRGLLCDLDGVVYRGDQPCPGAVEGLAAARAAGRRILFMTNNAGHRPQDVERRLLGLGVAVEPGEVLTSSMVAADYVAEHHQPGDGEVVLAVGGPGVRLCLELAGLQTVTPADLAGGTGPRVSVVVQGYGPDIAVADLNEAVYAIQGGATWVATNADATLPSERGLAPGNGSLLAAVGHATGRAPDIVVGKPEAPAYLQALRLLGLPAEQVLALGDRLDTDIAGAKAVGIPTALVLTGVHGRCDAAQAPPELRPDLIVETIPDLGFRSP